MPRYLVAVQRGPPSQESPPDILEVAHNGGKGAWLLRDDVQGARGVTQEDLLSPTIINVVVNAVVRNWVTVMIAIAEERGKSGKDRRH